MSPRECCKFARSQRLIGPLILALLTSFSPVAAAFHAGDDQWQHLDLDSADDGEIQLFDHVVSLTNDESEVFEDKQAATEWLSRTNEALGGQAPIMLCETDIGAKQVRRALHAMEWGGAA